MPPEMRAALDPGRPTLITGNVTGYCPSCGRHKIAESHLCEGTLTYADGSISTGGPIWTFPQHIDRSGRGHYGRARAECFKPWCGVDGRPCIDCATAR